MRKSSTIGFSVEDADRDRLEDLAERYGGGNRSAFLRSAMDLMERVARAEDLAKLQGYGSAQLSRSGFSIQDIPRIVDAQARRDDPQTTDRAKAIVSDLISHHGVLTTPYEQSDEDRELAAALSYALDTATDHHEDDPVNFTHSREDLGDGVTVLAVVELHRDDVQQLLRKLVPSRVAESETQDA